MTSVSNASKKRKTDDSSGKMPTLQEALIGFTEKVGVRIYYGLEDFVDACRSGAEEIIRVCNSTHYASLEDFGHCVTPRFLRSFTTVRDDRSSRIIRIHDSTSRLEGPKLSRAMALEHLTIKGYDVIVFSAKGSDTNEALAMSVGWEIEEDVSSKKRDHVKTILKLYHERGFTRLFCTRDQLCDVLSLGYITLHKTRSVAQKLNNLIERQDFDLDVTKVDGVKRILEETSSEAKACERSFMGELLSCAVAGAGWKTKISAFKKFPSANVARLLDLKKPYSGKLYSQSTTRQAEMVLLRDLDDEDKVLFSTVPVDTKFYASVTGTVQDWKVYKASSDLGVLKDRKGWTPLTGQLEISAKLTSSLLRAIADDNSSAGGALVAAEKEDDTSEKLKDDVDF